MNTDHLKFVLVRTELYYIALSYMGLAHELKMILKVKPTLFPKLLQNNSIMG